MTPEEAIRLIDLTSYEHDRIMAKLKRDQKRFASFCLKLNGLPKNESGALWLYGKKVAEWVPTADGLILQFYRLNDDEQACLESVEQMP